MTQLHPYIRLARAGRREYPSQLGEIPPTRRFTPVNKAVIVVGERP